MDSKRFAAIAAFGIIFLFLAGANISYSTIVLSVTPSASNITVDQGAISSIPFNALATGGSGNYIYSSTVIASAGTSNTNYCDFNSITSTSTSPINLFNLGSSGFLPCGINNLGGPGLTFDYANTSYNISISAQDATSGGGTVTVDKTFNIYPSLTFNSLSVTPSEIYTSNTLVFGVSWYNATGVPSGVPPFTVSITYGTSTSCAADTIPATGLSGITSSHVTFSVTAPNTPDKYYYCASVLDSSYDSPQTVSSLQPVAVTVVAPATISQNFPDAVDVGQQVNVGFVVHDGIGPFTVAAYSTSNNTQVSNTINLPSPDSSSGLSFNAPKVAGTYTYKLEGTDERTNSGGTGPSFSFNSVNLALSVSNTLKSPVITLSSNSIEQGQPFSANALCAGGTPTDICIINIYNASSHTKLSGFTYTQTGSPYVIIADSIASNQLAPGQYYLNATASDSSAAGHETNASSDSNFIITPGPDAIESLSSASVTYPNAPIITVSTVNGIAPYSFTLDVYSSNGVLEFSASNDLANTIASRSYSLPTLASGSYQANVVLTDSASPAVAVDSSNSFSIEKGAPPIYISTQPSSSFTYNNTGIAYYYGFNGINTQQTLSLILHSRLGFNVPPTGNIIATAQNEGVSESQIAISPNGTQLYIPDGNTKLWIYNISNISSSVSFFGIFNGIGFFNGIDGIAFSPNGTLAYALNGHNNTISQFVVANDTNNFDDGRPNLRTIKGFNDPISIAITPNGKYAFVTNSNNNTISKVNLSTGNIILTITPSMISTNHSASPHGLAISPNGNTLYVANGAGGSNSIGSIDLLNTTTGQNYGRISARGMIQPLYLSLGQGGRFLYVTDFGGGSENITIIDTSTMKSIGNIAYSGDPQGITMQPNSYYGFITFANDSLAQVSVGEGSGVTGASAGTYNFSLAGFPIQNYTGTSVAANITIFKATPTIDLTSIPSFIYTGNELTVNYGIFNTLQKLAGLLTLNGNIIATYNGINTNQTATVNAVSAGIYNLKFFTLALGNENYSAANTLESFVISAQAAKTSISGKFPAVYNNTNATVTASISSDNAIGNVYMSLNGGNYLLVSSTSSTDNLTTYNAPGAAGTYSFKFYNNPTPSYAENTSFLYYTITKGIPQMSFNKSCASYTANGSSCVTTASISSIGGQIIGNLYVNGNLVGSTNSVINYTGSNAIGTYSIEFTTLGNGNYIPRTSIYSYSITKASNNTNNKGLSGGGGAGIPQTTIPPTTITTRATTVATTTVPQQPVITGRSNRTYTGTTFVSGNHPFNLNFSNLGAVLKFSTTSQNQTSLKFNISNYTISPPKMPNHKFVEGISINFSSNSTVTLNVTIPYNCSAAGIVPYLLVNGQPVALNNYTVDKSACTVSFGLSSDPVILLYANQSSIPQQPSQPTFPSATKYNTGAIAAAIVIVAAIAAVSLALRKNKQGRRHR